MFIPLKDLNPSRTYPFVNITLIVANVVVFMYEIGLEATLPKRAFDALLLPYSTVPARFPAFLAGHTSFEVSFVPLVTSMFLPSGFLHLAGNMQFLAGLSTIGVKVTGGVAVWAHIGGFLLGMLLTTMVRRR